MTFPKDTIRLGTAQRIFPQFDIKEQLINDQPTGIYSATLRKTNGETEQLIEKGLTNLCIFLVEKLAGCYTWDSRPIVRNLTESDLPGSASGLSVTDHAAAKARGTAIINASCQQVEAERKFDSGFASSDD